MLKVIRWWSTNNSTKDLNDTILAVLYLCHACLTTVRMNLMTFQSKLNCLEMMECSTEEIRGKRLEIKPWKDLSVVIFVGEIRSDSVLS